MTAPTANPKNRIPNLHTDAITDINGHPTPAEQIFRQQTVNALQLYIGSEGLVMPALTADQITTIVGNQNAQGVYTCAPGTLFYETDATPDSTHAIKVTILVAGVPTLKTITIT